MPFHSKIGYVKRLNRGKARSLSDIFFRLGGARKEKRIGHMTRTATSPVYRLRGARRTAT